MLIIHQFVKDVTAESEAPVISTEPEAGIHGG